MKRILAIILVLLRVTVYAHEDHYESIELSNVHIKVCDQYENSLEIGIVTSYADVINKFVRSIDSSALVFLQYDVDYCYFNSFHYHIFYTGFYDAMIPEGFPFGYNYDLGFLEHESGLVINSSRRHFKLEPILRLIEFGLKNPNLVVENHKAMLSRQSKPAFDSIRSERSIYVEGKLKRYLCTGLTDSVINSDQTSELVMQTMNAQVAFKPELDILASYWVRLYLQEDDIQFVLGDSLELLAIPSLHSISFIDSTAIFVFDTNQSFMQLNLQSRCKSDLHDLPFAVGCLDSFGVASFGNKDTYQIYLNSMLGGIDYTGVTYHSETDELEYP